MFQSAAPTPDSSDSAEIARRSAKHSAEFLSASGQVSRELAGFQDPNVTSAALALANAFAMRAGGIAADAWTIFPEALAPSWNWHLVTKAARSRRLPWLHRASPSATRDEFVGINECG